MADQFETPNFDLPIPVAKRNRFEAPAAPAAVKPDDEFAEPMAAPTPRRAGGRWDSMAPASATPQQTDGMTPTPLRARTSRWDTGATPTPAAQATRWDPTPSLASDRWNRTPSGATPVVGETPRNPSAWGETPILPGATPDQRFDKNAGFAMPVDGADTDPELAGLDPRQQRVVRDIQFRNRYLTDEEIEAMIPPGYEVVPPPSEYAAAARQRKQAAEAEAARKKASTRVDAPENVGENLPALRPEDAEIFAPLLQYRHITNDADLPADVAKTIMVLRCLLRVKNGDSKQRKMGTRILGEKAKFFGAKLLFQQIFALWMSETMDESEKHAVVKVIDRVLFRLGDLVADHVPTVLTLIQPLLTDPDPFTREEAREVTANLARAAGMKHIVLALRKDIDDPSDDIRQLTARTLAIVAQVLGVELMGEFLFAVCNSQRSPNARHTGLKIVAEIAVVLGAGVRKHLKLLLHAIRMCVTDQQVRVKIQAATTVSALAEACHPHGIDEFAPLLDDIRRECRTNRGKVLGAFLKAMGSMIGLMPADLALEQSKALVESLVRGFTSVDEELRRVVVRVVQQIVQHPGIPVDFINESLSASFFEAFWTARLAMDRRTARQLVDTTVSIARRVGTAMVLFYLVQRLKDKESEQFQKITLEALQRVIDRVGVTDLYADLVSALVDSVLECVMADQSGSRYAATHGLIAVVKGLESRMGPYATQVVGLVTSRLEHAVSLVRKQAADVIFRTAGAIANCGQHALLPAVSRLIAQRLGNEVDGDALAAQLRALRAIFEAVPSPSDFEPEPAVLLHQLTTVIKNPHEDVQEYTIELIGTVARAVNANPEMCDATLRVRLLHLAMEGLFYLLKSKRKRTRVVTAETFGEIATAITPIPIVKQLLNNLKKDDRTERICTEVALAVVAKRCHPFVVVPFLINEFRVSQGTELAEKTQHAVLKTLRFLFEYLGSAAVPYMASVVPLLDWCLTDKSLQYRRMASEVIRHMALAAVGHGQQDIITHLLNSVHPNLIETTIGSEQERLTSATVEVLEACCLAIGPAYVVRFLEQGLWHPSRKVRDSYWRAYNAVYLLAGDAFVPVYAPIPDMNGATYGRHLLSVIV